MTDKEKKEIYMCGYVDGMTNSEELFSDYYQTWEPLLLDWLRDDSKSFESMPHFEIFDDYDEEDDDFGDDELDDYYEMSDETLAEIDEFFDKISENVIPVNPNWNPNT